MCDDEDSDEDQQAADPFSLSKDSLVNIGNKIGESTKNLNRTVMRHFNSYLAHLNDKYSSEHKYREYSKSIPLAYYSQDLFGTFPSYLIEVRKIKTVQTCLNYLSKIKMILENDYEGERLPFLVNPSFYSRVRQNTLGNYLQKCLKTGESLVTSAVPMTKEDIMIMCQYLLSCNSLSANEDRCLLIHQFQVCSNETSKPIPVNNLIYFMITQRTPTYSYFS